ncbi:hypothetical protein [Curtobacterium sp. Leaf261]|uniref:hypothetical protein n=1 Tax=Curtobacterium sp. Leaf261 TaxID=1736311 RepID=UPI000701B6D5|nr:hypothetical protein [Curtobacterium sp. Leaf261]KQO62183.1 hypothetical protein ASF23_10160 [Curtobacterium sp. Leaf261]
MSPKSVRRIELRSRAVPALVAIGLGSALVLAGCSTGDDTVPSPTRSHTRSSTPSPSTSPAADDEATTGTGGSTGTGTGDTGAAGGSGSSDGAGDDGGTGDGTGGNGTGGSDSGSASALSDAQLGTIGTQAIAAAGATGSGGAATVLSATGSSDEWTVVTAGADGSETQSVVSLALGRVSSGPFPKSVDAATQSANRALTAAASTGFQAAAAAAQGAVPRGTLTAIQLGGSASTPRWTATVSASGAAHTVVVDAASGRVLSTS